MITPDYCKVMARYNAWQNKNIWGVVQAMNPDELNRDRGAFFGSIQKTLNHLMWGDMLWLSRFQGTPPPDVTMADSTEMTVSASTWWADRFPLDGRITAWAARMTAIELAGQLHWTSVVTGQASSAPIGFCITHFFNHQTHHRGQVHAMLTASGQSTQDTDLVFLPED